MAANWSSKAWTDGDVAALLQAAVYLKRHARGEAHFAHFRPLAEKWSIAQCEFVAPTDGSRARARQRLKALIAEVCHTPIDWSIDLQPGGAAECRHEAGDRA